MRLYASQRSAVAIASLWRAGTEGREQGTRGRGAQCGVLPGKAALRNSTARVTGPLPRLPLIVLPRGAILISAINRNYDVIWQGEGPPCPVLCGSSHFNYFTSWAACKQPHTRGWEGPAGNWGRGVSMPSASSDPAVPNAATHTRRAAAACNSNQPLELSKLTHGKISSGFRGNNEKTIFRFGA